MRSSKKFATSVRIGLFDYALNTVWNKRVFDLPQKASAYELEIFCDAAIEGALREFYKTEDD